MAVKVDIIGASNFVNRMYEACGTYQWAREFLKNSLEASATRIEFGIEWEAVAKLGVYRRTVIDNGCGMNGQELVRFFSTLGTGVKKIGGIHDNFGVGAKIAALPWNPQGLVVISYKGGQSSMIHIVLNPESEEYELAEFSVDGEKSCVIDPSAIDWSRDPEGIEWAVIRPDWVEHSGTIIVLLGSNGYPNTVLGNPDAGEHSTKGISIYLNSRFWDLSNEDVRVVELRSERRENWPTGPDETDDAKRPNRRRIHGARYWLGSVQAQNGQLGAKGTLILDQSRVKAEWYLWEGGRPVIHTHAKESGYIAILYKDELFQLTQHKAHFRWFGVVETKVQQCLTIILEPQLFTKSSKWGIHPDQSRNRLIFTGDGQKGIDVPLSDWGLEFADNMPDPIRKAIQAARGDFSGSIDDEEYRKRLQDKFGDRWKVKRFFKPRVEEVTAEIGGSDLGELNGLVTKPQTQRKVKQPKSSERELSRLVDDNGTNPAIERETPVDVPKYRFESAEQFEQEWHIALWSPHDVEGPTVIINYESPVLLEVIKYHQDRYPDVYAEQVSEEILKTFGEVAACKIAHSQKLARLISEQELDQYYRCESALTIALMGLISEDSLIVQRLTKLGRSRAAE